MRDVFYTILVVWLVWQIMRSVSAYNKQKQTNNSSAKKQGETSVDYIPPQKSKFPDGEGEYVDYEEIK
jgi:hypothetical protein